MIIKSAYYPHQLPTKIVVEALDGQFYSAELSPFRPIVENDLHPLAFFRHEMGDEIPDYTLRHYHLVRDSDNVVRRLRIEASLSQAKLAQAAGLNIRQIQKIEAGEILTKNITLETAVRLAKALGVEPADLID